MKRRFAIPLLISLGLLSSGLALANDTLLGALLGGGSGALVGRALGGRQGAVIGGVLGAAAGASIAAEDDTPRVGRRVDYYPAQPVYYAQEGYYPPQTVYYAPAPRVVAPPPVIYIESRHRRDDWHHRPHHDRHDRRDRW